MSRCLDDQARAASFQHKHGALTSALKLTVVEWLVESETKTSVVTWQHANSTIVGSSVYTVESVDSQGLNYQMQVIAICGLSLWIYCWMSLVWIWLLTKVCSSQHNVLTVSVFLIPFRRIDHKHGKMLSDHRDAGLEQKWPRMADENLPTNLLIFCYLVKKTPWIDFLMCYQLIW